MSIRIWEIDFIRGIAILAMIFFHLVVDLSDFFGYGINYLSGFWYYEGKAAACTFILLAGISATLHRKNAVRGVRILTWGMVLSAVTFLYNPETYIRYGILHLLGSCMLIYHVLQRLSALWLLSLATLFSLTGHWTASITLSTSLLLPLGIIPEGFVSIDYYPFLPWSGVFFCGSFLGKSLYRTRRSLIPTAPFLAPIITLGRHSLAVYLVHQPVLLALLWVYHRI